MWGDRPLDSKTAGWHGIEPAKALAKFDQKQIRHRMLGYLCTTWGKQDIDYLADFPRPLSGI